MNYHNILKEQLDLFMHEIISKSKEIFENSNYRHLNRLCELDITILTVIYKKEEITAKEISTILKMPKTTVVSAVKRMCNRGYIQRIPNQEDKREMKLILTMNGIEANREHDGYEEQILEFLVTKWGEDEQKKLVDLLKGKVGNHAKEDSL